MEEGHRDHDGQCSLPHQPCNSEGAGEVPGTCAVHRTSFLRCLTMRAAVRGLQ